MITHVVMDSGGVGSWASAVRTIEQFGAAHVARLFANTKIEDADLYRFLDETTTSLGVPLTRVEDGRTPWDVFRAVRLIGNSRVAPCSRVLKQEPCRRWMEENAPNAVVVLGIDWTEEHRLGPARAGWAPFEVDAPLCRAPYRTKHQLLRELRATGIEPPRLYAEGFPHNNCGGGCVRAGVAHFKLLYRRRPEVFAEWETEEAALRAYLGKDVAILRRRGGSRKGKAFPLSELRAEIEKQPAFGDGEEWGGCGCFLEGPT